MSFLDDIANFLNTPGGQLLASGATTLGSILFTNAAADDIADAAAAAGAIETQYNDQAIQELGRQFNITRAELQPFLQAGTGATNELSRLLVQGGMMDPEMITQSPGYQFRLSEGQKAIDRAQSAGGYRLSGRALKELQRYTQDYASGEFDNYMDRLANLAGLGRNTAGDLATSRGTLASNIANLLQRSGTSQADAALTGGSADAGSTLTSGANILGLLASLTGTSPSALAAGLADLAGGGSAAPAAGGATPVAAGGALGNTAPLASGLTGAAAAPTGVNAIAPGAMTQGAVPGAAASPVAPQSTGDFLSSLGGSPTTPVTTPAQSAITAATGAALPAVNAGVATGAAGATPIFGSATGGAAQALGVAPVPGGVTNAAVAPATQGASLSALAPFAPLAAAGIGAFVHNLTAKPNALDVFGRSYDDPMNMPFLDREGKPYWALINLETSPGESRTAWVNRTGYNQLPDGTSVFVSPSELYNLHPEKRDAQGRVLGTSYADPYANPSALQPTIGYAQSPEAKTLLSSTPGTAAYADLGQSSAVARDPGATNVLSALRNIGGNTQVDKFRDFINRVNTANAGRTMGLSGQAVDLIQSQMPGRATPAELTALGVATPTWWDYAMKFAPDPAWAGGE